MIGFSSGYTTLFSKKSMQWVVGASILLSGTLYAVLGYPNTQTPNGLLLIPRGCSRYQLKTQLKHKGYIQNGATFLWATYLLRYHPKNRPGQYRLRGNMNNWQIVRILRSGMQHPIQLTFSTAANKTTLVEQIVSRVGLTKEALWTLLEDTKQLAAYGFTPENVLTLFIPDTYEVYWTITAAQLLSKMHLAYQRFWNPKRLHQAKQIALSPVEVSILASIVQAETNNQQEAAMIAGVYLNRLKRNIPLQSCPMLIYAIREAASPEYSSLFEKRRPASTKKLPLEVEFQKRPIRRVLEKDTYIDSPYNSYRKKGLPPGPIGLPSMAMIDAVLNYTTHDYLFFSAKEDFSGSHYFARNYTEHLKNARKYKKALNKLQIMR